MSERETRHRCRDVDQRYRWDLLHAAGWQCSAALYADGLTDAHIDTALRAIVQPLRQDA